MTVEVGNKEGNWAKARCNVAAAALEKEAREGSVACEPSTNAAAGGSSLQAVCLSPRLGVLDLKGLELKSCSSMKLDKLFLSVHSVPF